LDWCEAHGLVPIPPVETILHGNGGVETRVNVPKNHFGTPIKDPVSGAFFFRPIKV
jgi:hypothetical protein